MVNNSITVVVIWVVIIVVVGGSIIIGRGFAFHKEDTELCHMVWR